MNRLRSLTLMGSFLKTHPRLRLFLFCALLVTVIFPDVVFKNATISMLDQVNFTGVYRPVESFYHDREFFQPYQGFYDFGGAAFQSEPAIQFMRHSIYNFQSPYWNPFSGAGSFGPETMVDLKFSPLSLSVALLGGSNLAFHFVTLLFYTLSIFFLALTLIEHLGFSLRTALATSAVYLLNGYFTYNLSSNTNQAYLYFPFALFAILSFCLKPSVKNYLYIVFAYILAMSVTFFPTTVLMITGVGIVALGASIHTFSSWKKRGSMLLLQMSAPLLSGLMLAFIYLPLYEAMNFVGSMGIYSKRVFYAANYQAFISLFSSKHVFEAHNAMNPDIGNFMPNVIYHFGLISGCIVMVALFSRRWFKDTLQISFVFLLALSLGRIFGLPGLSQLINHLPFYGNIGGQYWWMMVAISFPMVFAYGMNQIEQSDFAFWPSVVFATLIILDAAYIISTYGMPKYEGEAYLTFSTSVLYLITAGAFILLTLAILYSIKRGRHQHSFLTLILSILVFAEMNYYFSTSRFRRVEMFHRPPDYVLFLKEHLGLNRVAAYGSSGFPPELGTAYQLQQIEFFSMNILPSYYEFCQKNLTSEHGWWGKDTFCVNRDTTNEPNVNTSSLDLLSVRYVVISNSMKKFISYFENHQFSRVFEANTTTIFENPHVFPRTYAVSRLVKAPGTPDSQNLDAKSVAFTEDQQLLNESKQKNISAEIPLEKTPSHLFERPKIITYENTRVVIEANFSEPGILILPDNWHPSWKAWVDDRPTYIGKVNETFRGVALETGKHQIVMTYQPSTLSMALKISSMVFFSLFLLYFKRKKVDLYLKRLHAL